MPPLGFFLRLLFFSFLLFYNSFPFRFPPALLSLYLGSFLPFLLKLYLSPLCGCHPFLGIIQSLVRFRVRVGNRNTSVGGYRGIEFIGPRPVLILRKVSFPLELIMHETET